MRNKVIHATIIIYYYQQYNHALSTVIFISYKLISQPDVGRDAGQEVHPRHPASVIVGEDGGQVVIDVLEHGPGQGYGTAAGVDGRKVQPGHRHIPPEGLQYLRQGRVCLVSNNVGKATVKALASIVGPVTARQRGLG